MSTGQNTATEHRSNALRSGHPRLDRRILKRWGWAGAQIASGLTLVAQWGCVPNENTKSMRASEPETGGKSASLRLEEQPSEIQIYATKIAKAKGASAIAEEMRSAFQEAGSPESLRPIVKEAYARQQELQRDLELTRQQMEARYAPPLPNPELIDLPLGAWYRVVLGDRSGSEKRIVFGVMIELDDMDDDGECDLKFACAGQKLKFKELRVSAAVRAFGIDVCVQSLDRATESVCLLVRRATLARR